MLAGRIWRWKGLWVAARLSIVIELLQLITARGLCEFDDVIHNMVGAVIGMGLDSRVLKMLQSVFSDQLNLGKNMKL